MEKLALKKTWIWLSMICFLIGIAVWIPNILFQKASSYWLLTFVINPIGIYFGYLGKSKIGKILNIFMTGSFFIFMVIGYLINFLFGGKP
jgi:hypothetical protein